MDVKRSTAMELKDIAKWSKNGFKPCAPILACGMVLLEYES